jgi:outer membrane lipoprotein-sorting protein
MRIALLLMAIGMSLSLQYSFAQDAKSQAILDKLSKKVKSLKTFYVEFNASVKNSKTGQNENFSGKGWVKGNKYNASYGSSSIISNGARIWTVLSKDKEIYETSVGGEDEVVNPKKLMTIWETGFKNAYVKSETLNGTVVDVINLTPKNAKTADYNKIVVYISRNNELKKAVMNTKDGTVMTYTVSKFTSNPSVSDTKFVLDKKNYPGYTVYKD